MDDVFAMEAMLRDQYHAAQGSSKNASLENTYENGLVTTILSDLSARSATVSFAARDACPVCGGREWRLSPRGTRICRVCLHRAN